MLFPFLAGYYFRVPAFGAKPNLVNTCRIEPLAGICVPRQDNANPDGMIRRMRSPRHPCGELWSAANSIPAFENTSRCGGRHPGLHARHERRAASDHAPRAIVTLSGLRRRRCEAGCCRERTAPRRDRRLAGLGRRRRPEARRRSCCSALGVLLLASYSWRHACCAAEQ
jgi:hypothetical protein